MQNTKQTQKRIVTLLALTAISFAVFLFTPQVAQAKSYSMPQVDMQANVTTNGDLEVTEQRIFDFSGSFTAVWWNFGELPANAELKFNEISITRVDKEGNPIGDTEVLSRAAFQTGWREEGGPGYDAYSVDEVNRTVYAFFDANNERLQVNLDYKVVNGVNAWKDVGELYWKYNLAFWEEPSENVTLEISLPIPEGTEVALEENVFAWGHGPYDGHMTLTDDNKILYEVPHVNSGQFAEARVTFPVEWLSDFEPPSSIEETRLDISRMSTVLKEEQTWADEANRERVLSLMYLIVCAVISIILILGAIVAYFKYGKEYQPDFTEEYWRDIPSPEDHPTVIARLWRWNRESTDDFTTALMYLSHLGAIQINKGSYEKPGVFGSQVIDDYYMTRIPSGVAKLTNPIDLKTIEFLFDKIGKGADSLWFGSIKKYGEDNPEEFVEGMKEWQGVLTAETNKRDFFEFKSQKIQMLLVVIAVLYVIAGVLVVLFQENFIPLFFVVPVSIALFGIAAYMPRRSPEGNNIDAKAKALKNWLRDFSSLDERPPTEVKVWGEFMVYAFIFGIAKQVIADLQMKVPEVLKQDSGSMMESSYAPWWFWYSASHSATGDIVSSAGDMFHTSITNTMNTAQAAISAASGDFSSGGGGGGGFSGGGGGGFGGGGGGGAR